MAWYNNEKPKRPGKEYWLYENLHDYTNYTVEGLRGLLAARGYAIGSATTPKNLPVALKRSDLGLLSYTNRPNHELRELIQQRGLNKAFQSSHECNRTDLLKILNDADDDRRFHKLQFSRLKSEEWCTIITSRSSGTPYRFRSSHRWLWRTG